MCKIPQPPTPKEDIIGLEPNSWCKFYKDYRHHTEDCSRLKKEIERLIHEGHLNKYVKHSLGGGSKVSSYQGRDVLKPPRSSNGKDPSKDDDIKTICHMLNTIA